MNNRYSIKDVVERRDKLIQVCKVVVHEYRAYQYFGIEIQERENSESYL